MAENQDDKFAGWDGEQRCWQCGKKLTKQNRRDHYPYWTKGFCKGYKF